MPFNIMTLSRVDMPVSQAHLALKTKAKIAR
jgi:hypothetical protein